MHEWIKLHTALRYSAVYQDPAAKVVFFHLLIIADDDGKGRISRFKSSIELRMKPSTFAGALKRCQENYLLCDIKTNKLYTTFSLNNWGKYQTLGDNKTDSKPTIDRQQTDSRPTLYKEKNKNKSRKENNIKDISSGRDVAEHLISVFNQATGKNYSPTSKRCKLISDRLGSFPSEQLEKAAMNVAKSPFHMGKNDRGWSADPDWLFRNDENVDKMLNLEVKEEKKPLRLGYKAVTERSYETVE